MTTTDTTNNYRNKIPSVRISGTYDEHDIPLVRLTRTVKTGFGIGIGIWLAMVVIIGIPFLLFSFVFLGAV